MKIIKAITSLSAALIILNGCSGFQLASQKKSVIVEKVSADSFKVNFCGNAYMSRQEVDKYALQRASELTLSKGYSHFVVLSKEDNSEICMLDRNMRYSTTIAPQKSEKAPAEESQTFIRPNVTLTIQLFHKGRKLPEGAIDAQDYLSRNFPGMRK